jgi:hypothetical protein
MSINQFGQADKKFLKKFFRASERENSPARRGARGSILAAPAQRLTPCATLDFG